MKNTFIKVICPGLGLAMGLMLIAKIYFGQTYDNFYPDADRIYKVHESFVLCRRIAMSNPVGYLKNE